MGHRIGIQILSFNKPEYLERTLESLMKVKSPDDKICVIEQSDKPGMQEKCIDVCKKFPDIRVIPLFKNFGQRGATNILYETGFWNDCDFVMLTDHDNIFHDNLDIYCHLLNLHSEIWVTTGYHSPEHDVENKLDMCVIKSTARAGHMVLRKKDFYTIMPSDTKAGEASWFCGLDWWINC